MAEAPTPQAPPPFWRFLAEWLRTRGVTQRDLSKRAGVHETVVSKWLHQDATIRIRPGSRTIPQLAAVLEISTDDLLAMIQADENQLANRRAAARLERSVAESDALDPELVATAAALRDGWPTWDDGFRRAVQTLISGARGRLIDAQSGHLFAYAGAH